MKLKCIIIDDEEGARQVLELYLARLDYAELAGTFSNAIDAFQYMKQNKADVLLLDINMPEINGFSLLDMLANKPTVIFTTAYSDHALKGFEYGAVDYLHKPIRFARFVVAMEKALKWSSIVQEEATAETISLRADGLARELPLADIFYIESLGNYIKVHSRDKTYIVHATMNEMESMLPANNFIRIHKSYIINSAAIGQCSEEKVLINNTSIPVGKTYKKYFAAFIKPK